MNVNRIVQDAVRAGIDYSEAIREQAKKNHKYLIAYNELLKEELANGLLPIYSAGYISLEKQYLTQGINGLVEAAEFLGIDITPNEKYFDFCRKVLSPIMQENKKVRDCALQYITFTAPDGTYKIPALLPITVIDQDGTEKNIIVKQLFNSNYKFDTEVFSRYKVC